MDMTYSPVPELNLLTRHFGLTAPEDHEALVPAAQEEFGQRFARWAKPLLPGWAAG